MVSASSWSWVTKRKVLPVRSWSDFSSICICRRSLASSARRAVRRGGAPADRARAPASARRAGAGRRRAAPACGRHSPRAAREPGARRRGARSSRGEPPLQLKPEGDVAGDGHMREQRVVLEHDVHVAPVRRHVGHVPAGEHDAAVVGSLEAAEQPKRRRLAAARGAEQSDEAAGLDARGRGRRRRWPRRSAS